MEEQNKIIIYNTIDGKASVSLFARDGSVWMNQNQIAELFATSKQNIGQHISNILEENELEANSVVKNYLTTEFALYEIFDQRRKTTEALEADAQDMEALKTIEETIKKIKA